MRLTSRLLFGGLIITYFASCAVGPADRSRVKNRAIKSYSSETTFEESYQEETNYDESNEEGEHPEDLDNELENQDDKTSGLEQELQEPYEEETDYGEESDLENEVETTPSVTKPEAGDKKIDLGNYPAVFEDGPVAVVIGNPIYEDPAEEVVQYLRDNGIRANFYFDDDLIQRDAEGETPDNPRYDLARLKDRILIGDTTDNKYIAKIAGLVDENSRFPKFGPDGKPVECEGQEKKYGNISTWSVNDSTYVLLTGCSEEYMKQIIPDFLGKSLGEYNINGDSFNITGTRKEEMNLDN